jgi:GH15 family glucan-1,4-alpha-glucosidase
MAWVAFDRGTKTLKALGGDGLLERWCATRDAIRSEIYARGWNDQKGAFTQSYGSSLLDASLLMMPQVGFLPANDPRFVSTVQAIERELMYEGFVLRYPTEGQDGLPPGEGAFIACSFWLADCYALMGRTAEARALFERLLSLRNDVGLLSEEYDPVAKRMLGNFPQAFSHVGLINTAFNLTSGQPAPAQSRRDT